MKLNKIFIPFSTFLLLAFSVFLVGCEDNITTDNYLSDNYVGFSFDKQVALSEGDTETVQAVVYASKATNADRTINLYVDESSTAVPAQYAVPASVTIPAGSKEGTIDISVYNDGALGFGGKTIVLGMEPQDGIDMPTTYSGNVSDGTLEIMQRQLVVTAKDLCLGNQLKLEIELDSYPEELYWWIEDASGTEVANPGPYSTYNNPYTGMSGNVVEELCLPDGTYTFYIYDDYGDGAGPLTLTGPDGEIYSTDGSYGSYDLVEFTL
mgnify:CR=1 FL=1